MKMSVKTRIAVAMTALVAVNLVMAGVSWSYAQRSMRLNKEAVLALADARLVDSASRDVERFVADGNALALALTGDAQSEELSRRTGTIFGSGHGAAKAIAQLPPRVVGDEGSVSKNWASLELSTYVWINRQAQGAGASLRMKRESNGSYRASVVSNLDSPTQADLSIPQIREAVRLQSDRLVNGELRRLGQAAEERARVASQREEQARRVSTSITLGLMLASLLAAVTASMALYRSIVSPLQKARRYADSVASGDLSATYPDHTDDEIGSLTRAVQNMKEAVVARIAIMSEMAGAVIVNAEDLKRFAVDAHVRSQTLTDPEIAEDAEEIVRHAGILSTLAAQMLEI